MIDGDALEGPILAHHVGNRPAVGHSRYIREYRRIAYRRVRAGDGAAIITDQPIHIPDQQVRNTVGIEIANRRSRTGAPGDGQEDLVAAECGGRIRSHIRIEDHLGIRVAE